MACGMRIVSAVKENSEGGEGFEGGQIKQNAIV